MFYLIDKPIGISSFDVIRQLRKITGIKKMWHCGTLDPLATGLILIATDNSTKLIPWLEKYEKTYLFTVDLSITSPSYDLGEPTESVDMSTLQDRSIDALREFLIAQTEQIPPVFSALHIDGKRAYDRARSGEQVTMPKRPIHISDLEILDIALPEITIRMTISAGGYIRSFAPILGEFFGVAGGCVTALRREKIKDTWGSLDISRAQTLEDFDPDMNISYAELFPWFAHITLEDISYADLLNGKTIPTTETYNNEAYCFVSCKDLTALVRYADGFFVIVRNRV